MASRARMNRPYTSLPWSHTPGSKWKRRKMRWMPGHESRTKENRTRANRRERRTSKPIRTED